MNIYAFIRRIREVYVGEIEKQHNQGYYTWNTGKSLQAFDKAVITAEKEAFLPEEGTKS